MRALSILFLTFLTLACGPERAQQDASPAVSAGPAGGDPAIGRERIDRYACLACHRVPGFDGGGSLGPSLEGMASRPTINGRVPNDPKTMAAFLQNPRAVDPQTLMAGVGVSEEDARHLAAFMATLK